MAPLDPIIHQQNRLQIIASLYRNRQAGFADLRDGLGLTPGNLQAHLAKLEEAGYVRSGRVLVGLSFEARYRITSLGAEAFRSYLDALREVLDETAPEGPRPRDGPE